ncbi:hypothetical protein M0802_000993 [Mischocyttarus mexicanus]|nr:hypothetical protein M0802_000993 [Mischocyttarus mexicanus]
MGGRVLVSAFAVTTPCDTNAQRLPGRFAIIMQQESWCLDKSIIACLRSNDRCHLTSAKPCERFIFSLTENYGAVTFA